MPKFETLHRDERQTIAAISTAIGEAALSVIRLSGVSALEIADKLFVSARGLPPSRQESHTSQYGELVDPESRRMIDEVILHVMRSPRTYTREDMVEINSHGGLQVTQKVLEACLKAGARLAAPGEFTLRAFLNGRMDLVQAEAVLDLIKARSDAAYAVSRSQLSGWLSKKIQAMRGRLIRHLSHLEASIDFPDNDIDPMRTGEIMNEILSDAAELESLVRSARIGIKIKEGLHCVLVGLPNVGKSSLMNTLLKTERVLVSSHPGTTRDVVEASVQIRGYGFKLMDTAGIGEYASEVDRQAVQRTRECVQDADLLIFVTDASREPPPEEKRLWDEWSSKKRVLVINKSDKALPGAENRYARWVLKEPCVILSCIRQTGFDVLEEALLGFLLQDRPEVSEEHWVSSVRHRELMEEALKLLKQAGESYQSGLSAEFLASDIRMALDALGEITGDSVDEEIIHKIFSEFCIGK